MKPSITVRSMPSMLERVENIFDDLVVLLHQSVVLLPTRHVSTPVDLFHLLPARLHSSSRKDSLLRIDDQISFFGYRFISMSSLLENILPVRIPRHPCAFFLELFSLINSPTNQKNPENKRTNHEIFWVPFKICQRKAVKLTSKFRIASSGQHHLPGSLHSPPVRLTNFQAQASNLKACSAVPCKKRIQSLPCIHSEIILSS